MEISLKQAVRNAQATRPGVLLSENGLLNSFVRGNMCHSRKVSKKNILVPAH